MKLVINGYEVRLADTERNRAVVQKLREWQFPGLTTMDDATGSAVHVNLGEGTPFVVIDSDFYKPPSPRGSRSAVTG